MSLAGKARTVVDLARQGRFGDVWGGLKTHLRSDTVAYGLRRDLAKPFPAPAAKIPIKIRPLDDRDFDLFRVRPGADLSADGVYQRMSRLRMLEEGLGRGYAAVDAEGRVGYVQWLFLPRDNIRIAAHFHGLFPRLAPDYALLEGAFTFELFRGKGVMSSAMALIAEEAGKASARYAITFVTKDNIPSLKGCERAGFEPYCVRTERHRFFRVAIEFSPLANDQLDRSAEARQFAV